MSRRSERAWTGAGSASRAAPAQRQKQTGFAVGNPRNSLALPRDGRPPRIRSLAHKMRGTTHVGDSTEGARASGARRHPPAMMAEQVESHAPWASWDALQMIPVSWDVSRVMCLPLIAVRQENTCDQNFQPRIRTARVKTSYHPPYIPCRRSAQTSSGGHDRGVPDLGPVACAGNGGAWRPMHSSSPRDTAALQGESLLLSWKREVKHSGCTLPRKSDR